MENWINRLIADRHKNLPKTEFQNIMKIAAENKEVISLGPGEPDFNTPEPIKEAVKKAIDENKTHYSTTGGSQELRELISKKLKKENNIEANPDEEICVTTGSTEGLFLISSILIEPKDEIIIPNPGYMNYNPTTSFFRGIPIEMNMLNENGFGAEIEEIKKKITEKTHVLIINTPSNPTGNVMKKKELEEIADIVNDNNNTIIFSDEAYEKLVYNDNKHISIASLNGMENKVMTFQSFSKSFAMAGFRVGYVSGSKEVIKTMKRIRIYSTLTNSNFSEYAAIEALKTGNSYSEKMKIEYERRGKMLHKRLNSIGMFECNKPEGAFYMFPNIRKFKTNSVNLSNRILNEAKVLVVPGTEFGKYGENHIRMSYATSYEKIEEAMDRLEKWVTNFK